jgi:hypothetical protein
MPQQAPPYNGAHMLQRAFVVFLALVTFWSAFAGQEHFMSRAEAAAVVADVLLDAQGGAASTGSVEDHHLDDQPGQPSIEHAPDQPTWFAATLLFVASAASTARLRSAAPSAFFSTVPLVPQRPPSA